LIKQQTLGEVYTGDDPKAFSILALKLLNNKNSIIETGTNAKIYFKENYSVSAAVTNILKNI